MLRSLGRTLLLFVVAFTSAATLAQSFRVDATLRQADGKTILAGNAWGQLSARRLNTDGTVDVTWPGGGAVHPLPLSLNDYRVVGMKELPDGRTLLIASTSSSAILLTRLDAAGYPDATFGTTHPGWVIDPVSFELKTALFEASGTIVGAGSDYSPSAGTTVPSLIRYTADGTRDTSFAPGGIRHLATTLPGEWRALIAMPGGKHVAVGTYMGYALYVGGFLSNWDPDPAFVNGGSNVSFHASYGDDVRAATLDASGSVVAVGSNGASDSKLTFYRIGADGQVLEFGERAVAIGQVPPYQVSAVATSVAPLDNGDILVAGHVIDWSAWTAHNVLTTWSAGDIYVDPQPSDYYYETRAVHVAGDEILAIAARDVGSNPSPRIARYFHSPFVFDRDEFMHPDGAPIFDIQPNAFTIAPQYAVPLSDIRTSAPFRVTGVTVPVPISVSSGTYSIGCTEPYTAEGGLVANGEKVCVRVTSSAVNGGTVAAQVSLSVDPGVQASFEVSTVGPPQTSWGPTQFGGSPYPANNSSVGFVLFYFSGTTESGPLTAFECSLDGEPFYLCADPLFGYPHTHFDVGYGTHTFRVRAVNSYGPDPTPAEYTWTAVGLTDIAFTTFPEPYSTQTTATITWVAPYTRQFECRLGAAAFAPCTSPMTFPNLADGTYVFQVRGFGTEGMGDPPTVTFTVDTVPPNAVIISGPPAISDSAIATFQLGSDITGGSGGLECRLDGGDWNLCQESTWFTVGAGAHALEVRVWDLAGNVDPTPATWNWTYEAAPPDTSIASGPSGTVTTRTVAFTYSATMANATFECSLLGPGHGGAFASCPSSGVTYNLLQDGGYAFQVRATSASGNTDPSPATQAFGVDGPAPQTTIVSGPSPLTQASTATFVLASDQPGATFECSLDNAPFGACPPQWLGYTGIAEGTHTFRGRAIAVGEADPSPVEFTWVVDRTAPQTTITSQPSNPSASSTATFTFAANEAPVTFGCRLDGQTPVECASPVTYTGLAAGSHTFEVWAWDGAMNTDQTAATSTWTVDLSLVDTTITSGPSGTVAVSTAAFAFSSPLAEATFECSVDGAAFAACTSPVNLSGLGDGAHTFQVRARNAVGDVDPTPASRTWTVDTSAPDTTLTSGPSGTTSQASAGFTFTATDGAATFQCSLDGAAWAACVSGVSYAGLSDGMHMFEVRAVDASGNTDPTPASRTWSIDTANPNTTITSGPAAVTSETGATLVFTATESSTFQCKLDAAAYGPCTSPVNLAGLASGSHTFSVYSVDAAGNADASPATWSWIIDSSAPETSITSAPSGTVATRSATITFASTEGGSTFACSLDGAAFAACASPVSLSGLADGAHTFAVQSTDGAGNSDASPAIASWTVDATAPDTSITASPASSSNSTSATFSFAATEAGGSFECQLDAGLYAACTSPVTYPGLGQGSHTFSVRARDAAGNQDATAATFAWTVDTAAPNTTIASGPSGGNNTNPVSFTFTSSEGGGTFECRMDGAAFATCASGVTYGALAKGQHTFEVRARDAAGNADASPATRSFGIK